MRRVSKRKPCLICGKPDWCGISADGAICVCMRISEGSVKLTPNGGYLHVLRDDPNWQAKPKTRSVQMNTRKTRRRDIGRLAAEYAAMTVWSDLKEFAFKLGVSLESLIRLRIGWLRERQQWSFPMLDVREHVCGIRLRKLTGKKLSVCGGREGLFWPIGIDFSGLLMICEGPTDTAAMLDLGFNAIGRPNSSGGSKHLAKLVKAKKPSGVVIVMDRDTNDAGQKGARLLSDKLLPLVSSVRIIQPPAGIKDAREWKRSGATRQDVLAAIESALVLTVRIGKPGK